MPADEKQQTFKCIRDFATHSNNHHLISVNIVEMGNYLGLILYSLYLFIALCTISLTHALNHKVRLII